MSSASALRLSSSLARILRLTTSSASTSSLPWAAASASTVHSNGLLPLSSPSLSLSSLPPSSRPLHTSSSLSARYKSRHTHKPFWHVKKTAKQADDPVTATNRAFVEEVKQNRYVNTRIDDDERNDDDANSPLRTELTPWPRQNGEWTDFGTTRCGLIGRKIGVTPMWLKDGKRVIATMIQVEDNHVIKYSPPEEVARSYVTENREIPRVHRRQDGTGYGCMIVGALSGDPEKFTKDYCGLFTSSGLMPKKKLAKFPVTQNSIIQPGTRLRASHFEPGAYLDIRGRTVRRGFQGVMRRWGFKGMPTDTHGVTKSHRRPGHIGSGRKKHRVWPKQKLPGHMGGDFIRMLGLQILRINYEEDIIYLKGDAVPGEPGEFVYLFDSKLSTRRRSESPRHFPTCYSDQHDALPEEEYADFVHRFHDPSIVFDAAPATAMKK